LADKHRQKRNSGGKKKNSSAKTASGNHRPLPDKSEILAFIASSPKKTGKREIGRAFGIRGAQRVPFKQLLRQMADEGLISGRRKKITRPGQLPAVTVLNITHLDDEGDLVARPEKWESEDEAPKILIQHIKQTRSRDSVGVGDRILARIDQITSPLDDGYPYHARIIKKLPKEHRELLGIFRRLEDGSGLIDPVDRKMLREWLVTAKNCLDVKDGELVRFMPSKSGRHHGASFATISARLGNPDEQHAISLIAIHRHGIPDLFPQNVLDELDDLPLLSDKNRTDLRDVPLITIDPFDARDHDDAVFARDDTDENNAGGFIVIVAIADVALYITPGSALDREALKRGNSVYFPDQVVPMLPEKISNNLCSLRENQERPCLAVQMRFDNQGEKIDHHFMRAIMRSHAKLSYEQAQMAIDGHGDKTALPLLDSVLKPLWHAWKGLMKARTRRHPLDLDLPERKIIMDDNGRIRDILTPERLEAHRVIEEFMIQANVCAAQTLDKAKSPLIYRIHPAPTFEKMQSLADFLQTIKIKFPRNAQIKAGQLNEILNKVAGSELDDLVNETILRSQSQAEYNTHNEGHFGLNLRQYAHFTSPIRRYADLIVHRALINALGFGDDGIASGQVERLDTIASDISDLERRAMAAERETTDRLIAYHLADNIGATFQGRISGVTRSGLFVRLSKTGADGFIPASTIGREYFYYDEQHQALIGEYSGETHRLGSSVTVRLVEAIPTAGALRFELVSQGEASQRQNNSSSRRLARNRKKTKMHKSGRNKRPGNRRRTGK
jgi:ribonuclease R